MNKKLAANILTGLNIIGVAGTAISAVRDSKKVKKRILNIEADKEQLLTKKEIAFYTASCYIPTFVIGLSTMMCSLGSNILNTKVQASLTSAYMLLENSFKDYRERVKLAVGEANESFIFDDGDYDSNDNEILFYEPYSNRYFRRTKEEVLLAEYHLNRNFILLGYQVLNDFYEFLNLDLTNDGSELGWNMYDDINDLGWEWIDVSHERVVQDDGLECYIIRFLTPPYRSEDYTREYTRKIQDLL